MGKGKGKKNGDQLPKQIAGVKIPKELRKLGGQAKRAAEHPVIGEMVVAALLAAAAALSETKPGKAAKRAAGEEAGGAARATAKGADRAKAALKAAAGAVGSRILAEMKDAAANPGRSGSGRKGSKGGAG